MAIQQPRLNFICSALIVVVFLLSMVLFLREKKAKVTDIKQMFQTVKKTQVSQNSRPCDSECKNFQELMRNWTHDKPKAAIVVLTHSKRNRIQELKLMINNLNQHFLNKYKYPIIIFHEKYDERFVSEIRSFKRKGIFFQEVEFQIPEFVNKSRVPELSCGRNIGYRHMCRFHAKSLYEEPIIDRLEYIFRLDDDSLITHPIEYDLFRYIKDMDISYGYMFNQSGHKECLESLWNTTKQYILHSDIKPTFFNNWDEYQIFYNNFEISKVEFWKGKQYQDYIEYIDTLGGIYYYRWGDAPIKTLGLSLFLPKEKLHQFSDVGYKHHYRSNEPSGNGEMEYRTP